MSTKKKTESMKFLESTAGRSLTLGGLIESYRLGEEMSQVAFAKKLGVSPSHLCDIEKGRKVVSAARAASFAKKLKKSEAQFVRLSLQDEISRSGLSFKVILEAG